MEPAAAAEFSRRWVARVLPPRPFTGDDRAAVTAAIRRCYHAANRRAPVTVAWCRSPDEFDRLNASAAELLDRLHADHPALRRRARLQAVLRPPVYAVAAGLAFTWGGLVIAVSLVLVLAMAPALGLLALAMGVPILLARQRSGRWWRRVLGAAVPGVAALTWLAALVLWPHALTVDVRLPPWPALEAGLAVAGAAAGLLVGVRWGWRRGRAPDHAVTPVDLVHRRIALRRWARLPRLQPVLTGAMVDAVTAADPMRDWMTRPLTSVELGTWALREHAAARWRRWGRACRTLAAHEDTARAAWFPYRRVAVALEPPREVHAGPSGLDRADGPAVVWADGTPWFFLRGTRVPRCPDDGPWTVGEIAGVRNSEVRRAMIESVGWEAYIADAGLELAASAPDPGNPPHELELYDLTWPDGECRLLLMTNGSPDRSGQLRRYAELVPADFDDPVEAVAWQYGVPVETYRDLGRRT